MLPFKFFIDTPIYFGRGCVIANSEVFKSAGRRAYVLTTKFPEGFENIALNDVIAALERENIAYEVNDNVEENPSVENEHELAVAAGRFGADFIVGVGGGSSIDAAKGLGVLINRCDEDPYEVFYGHGKRFGSFINMSELPIIVVPTTAGPGSDMTPNLILTLSRSDTKQCVDQTVYAYATMLDSRYIADAPDAIFYSGILDALAHGIESYLNVTSRFGNQLAAEAGFGIFSRVLPRLRLMDRAALTEDDLDMLLLNSSVMGAAVGQNGSSLPHGMGYDLSHYKGQYHGYASCIFLPEYLRLFKEPHRVEELLGKCGFTGVDDLEGFITAFTSRFMDFEVSEQEIESWANNLFYNTNRVARHPEPLGIEDIYRVYRSSLAPYMRPTR